MGVLPARPAWSPVAVAVRRVVAIELGVALQASVAGRPTLGALAGGLFLLAVWLVGPSVMAQRELPGPDGPSV